MRYFALHLCHMYKYMYCCHWCVATFTLYTHYLVCCAQMCVCCPIFASVLCIAHLCTHCATVLLCRIPRRWWLKVSAGSYDTSILPSSPTDQAEGGREMKGEVVFRRDTKSNLLKAVSGTEWMYRRGALERGRRVSVNAVVFVLCGYKCGFAIMSVSGCMFLSTLWSIVQRSCFVSSYPLLGVTLSYWFSAMFVKLYRRSSMLRLQVFETDNEH